MHRLLFVVIALVLAAPTLGADPTTLKGTIADSMCGMKHSADKHGEKAADHKACVARCIERGGEYVLATADKVYKIANQDLAALKEFAGQEVMVTGEVTDETITVSKVEKPKPAK
jgi:hypothetical protein